MRRILAAAVALAFSLCLSTAADAKSCRDAKGKFVKCPPPMTNSMGMMKKPCRDAKGKFIKCKTK
ncbi:MAG TPA: hypothetical protein VGD01_00860 [Candidatus Elarobacter sp.]|jgi:hypothetical protein